MPATALRQYIGGRPQMGAFYSDSELYLVDPTKGLLYVNIEENKLEIACSIVEGKPIRYALLHQGSPLYQTCAVFHYTAPPLPSLLQLC